ncbi:MAG: tetratricopeptide repeat protein [Pirellulales bacterium]
MKRFSLLILLASAAVPGRGAWAQAPLEPWVPFHIAVPAGPVSAWEAWEYEWVFGYPPDPLAVPQPLGHEIIRTSPNGYLYRAVYGEGQVPAWSSGPDWFPSGPPADAAAAEPGTEELLSQATGAFRAGRYESALDQLDRLLEIEPDHGFAELLRAQVLFARGEYLEAASSLEHALSIVPKSDWGFYIVRREEFFPSADRYANHLRALERFVREDPSRPEGRLLLAYHYLHLGRRLDGVRQLEAAVEAVDRRSRNLQEQLDDLGQFDDVAPPAPQLDEPLPGGPREF